MQEKNTKINYQIELERERANLKSHGERPHLLLHCCCAPCASYVMEYLSCYYDITAYYYNPNIAPYSEYEYRAKELERLAAEQGFGIKVVIEQYDAEPFKAASKGLEHVREGGERCGRCFDIRLSKAAEFAKENWFDAFATTLTISPLKNARMINEIGVIAGEKNGIRYICSDFKKRGGYQRSIELSHVYNLYRQCYCGCAFSRRDYEKRLMNPKA